jgi:hypothetical protein
MAIAENNLLKYIEKINRCKQFISRHLLLLGHLLNEIKEKEIYLERYQTFEEFLGSPEVSISRSTAYKAMAVSRFVLENKIRNEEIEEIDPDKVYRIIRVSEKDKNVGEWLEKAKTLSRSDLALEVREALGYLPNHDPAAKDIDKVRDFLYNYCKKKKIEPDQLELEELLLMFLKWLKRV